MFAYARLRCHCNFVTIMYLRVQTENITDDAANKGNYLQFSCEDIMNGFWLMGHPLRV